jgi:hypothetical protein
MTSPAFNALPRPALTAEEALMIQENVTLDRLILQATDSQEWDDVTDLIARKGDLEKRFDASRERTWRVWMAREYPPNDGKISA